MSMLPLNTIDLKVRAFQVVSRELGLKAALEVFGPMDQHGDYTRDREQLLGPMTMEDVDKELAALRAKQH